MIRILCYQQWTLHGGFSNLDLSVKFLSQAASVLKIECLCFLVSPLLLPCASKFWSREKAPHLKISLEIKLRVGFLIQFFRFGSVIRMFCLGLSVKFVKNAMFLVALGRFGCMVPFTIIEGGLWVEHGVTASWSASRGCTCRWTRGGAGGGQRKGWRDCYGLWWRWWWWWHVESLLISLLTTGTEAGRSTCWWARDRAHGWSWFLVTS